MPPTDRDLIARGLDLDAAAQPGPWTTRSSHFVTGQYLIGRTVRHVSDAAGYANTAADTELIVWMRNNLPEILRRWESDGRDLVAHAAVLEAVATELGIGAEGAVEEILPCIRQLRAELGVAIGSRLAVSARNHELTTAVAVRDRRIVKLEADLLAERASAGRMQDQLRAACAEGADARARVAELEAKTETADE